MFTFFDTTISANKNGTYTVKNFKAFNFLTAIQNRYNTAKFGLYSFVQPVRTHSLTFYSWYIPDLVFICESILNAPKKTSVMRGTAFRKEVSVFLHLLKTET